MLLTLVAEYEHLQDNLHLVRALLAFLTFQETTFITKNCCTPAFLSPLTKVSKVDFTRYVYNVFDDLQFIFAFRVMFIYMVMLIYGYTILFVCGLYLLMVIFTH